jgi:hypothetical protein
MALWKPFLFICLFVNSYSVNGTATHLIPAHIQNNTIVSLRKHYCHDSTSVTGTLSLATSFSYKK